MLFVPAIVCYRCLLLKEMEFFVKLASDAGVEFIYSVEVVKL